MIHPYCNQKVDYRKGRDCAPCFPFSVFSAAGRKMPKFIKTCSLSLCLFLSLSVSIKHTHTLFVCLFAILDLPVVTISLHACTHLYSVPCLPADSYPSSYPIKLSPPLWAFFSIAHSLMHLFYRYYIGIGWGHGLQHWPEHISTLVPLTCLVNLSKWLDLCMSQSPHF